MIRTLIGIALTSFGTVILSGCGGADTSYDGPQRATVNGTVTFEGQPLEAGSIKFVPNDNALRPVSALIGQGQYSIEEGSGPNLGEYRVEIYASEISASGGGEEEEEASEEEEEDDIKVDVDDEGTMNPQPENRIPRKYNYDSELSVEITSGLNTHDFDLKTD